jgi:murein DD-endopeptidase MepM/ murein hydrolase activator NlpD
VHPRQQPVGRYRGRRRLPKLPSRRYAAVVTTAFLGAGVVALGAGAVVPDSVGPGGSPFGDPTTQALAVEDRLNALDKANRSQLRAGAALSMGQGAPEVWLLPVRANFQITTTYEMRWGAFHWGLDMAAPYGTPIYAARAGIVTLAQYDGGYGNAVRIDHGSGVETVYGHASRILVKVGQKVEAGQLIALIGSTGYSTGNHLHFEVNVNGIHTDPMKFMLSKGVDIKSRLEAANGGTVIT